MTERTGRGEGQEGRETRAAREGATRGDSPVTEPVLAMAGVSRVYPGPTTALAGVYLAIHPGELVAIVGPSGSGKSTLLNLMGTLDRPTTGTVRLDRHDVTRLADRELSALRARALGFVFQQFHLVEGLTAAENVETALLYAGVPRRRRRPLALDALDRVGLGHRVRHLPHQLSGGERQRVAIARAIVNDPALILADEPTGALDTANGLAVLELLRTLNAEGATIAVITHDRDIARGMARRIVLRDGRIVGDAGGSGAGFGGSVTDRGGSGSRPVGGSGGSVTDRGGSGSRPVAATEGAPS